MLLALVGCNQLLDLRQTKTVDAAFFDAPTDLGCPIDRAPQFSRLLTQVVQQPVTHYTVTTSGRAIGACIDPNYRYHLCEGPVDGVLAAVSLSPSPDGPYSFVPRLSQDGQRIYLKTDVSTLLAFRRNSDGTWSQITPPGLPPTTAFLSPIAGTSGGDRFLLTGNGLSFEEWTDEGGTWHMTAVHPKTEFGVEFSSLTMTADGLEALLFDNQLVHYTTRDAVDRPFRTAVAIMGLPRTSTLYLTDDCSRVYATGLGSIFYVHRE